VQDGNAAFTQRTVIRSRAQESDDWFSATGQNPKECRSNDYVEQRMFSTPGLPFCNRLELRGICMGDFSKLWLGYEMASSRLVIQLPVFYGGGPKTGCCNILTNTTFYLSFYASLARYANCYPRDFWIWDTNGTSAALR